MTHNSTRPKKFSFSATCEFHSVLPRHTPPGEQESNTYPMAPEGEGGFSPFGDVPSAHKALKQRPLSMV